jgi:hypothetical protein
VPPAGWSYNKSDEACRKDSSVALSKNARIGVGVAVGVISVTTLVFWVWVFPRLFAPPH